MIQGQEGTQEKAWTSKGGSILDGHSEKNTGDDEEDHTAGSITVLAIWILLLRPGMQGDKAVDQDLSS